MHDPPLRGFGALIRSNRCPLLLMAGYATLIVALYRGTAGAWITLPWSLPALLGLTLAITSGCQAMRGRAQADQARRAGAAITATSRSWALLVQTVVHDRASARPLVQRHLAWLAAMRVQSRLGAFADARTPALQARERTAMLKHDLARHLDARELGRVLAADDAPSTLLCLQAEALRTLQVAGRLAPAPLLELHRLLHELQGLQVAGQRTRATPDAARQALAGRLLLATFGLLLPFGLLDALGPLVLFDDAAIAAVACALVVPLSVAFFGLYVALAGCTAGQYAAFDERGGEALADADYRALEQELRTTMAASAIVGLQARPAAVTPA